MEQKQKGTKIGTRTETLENIGRHQKVEEDFLTSSFIGKRKVTIELFVSDEPSKDIGKVPEDALYTPPHMSGMLTVIHPNDGNATWQHTFCVVEIALIISLISRLRNNRLISDMLIKDLRAGIMEDVPAGLTAEKITHEIFDTHLGEIAKRLDQIHPLERMGMTAAILEKSISHGEG